MHLVRQSFFAGTGFTDDQQRGAVARRLVQLDAHRIETRAGAWQHFVLRELSLAAHIDDCVHVAQAHHGLRLKRRGQLGPRTVDLRAVATLQIFEQQHAAHAEAHGCVLA